MRYVMTTIYPGAKLGPLRFPTPNARERDRAARLNLEAAAIERIAALIGLSCEVLGHFTSGGAATRRAIASGVWRRIAGVYLTHAIETQEAFLSGTPLMDLRLNGLSESQVMAVLEALQEQEREQMTPDKMIGSDHDD